MTVSDKTPIKVRNLTNDITACLDEAANQRYVFHEYQTLTIPAEALRRINASYGGGVLFQNYLAIENEELAREFDIPEDMIEHEYSWTKKDIDHVLLEGSIDELKDALEFAPEGIKESIVNRAVEMKLDHVAKRQVIKEFTGLDVDAKIRLKEQYEEATGTAAKEEAPRQRRVQSDKVEKTEGRRVK